jgi:hypothetical protein
MGFDVRCADVIPLSAEEASELRKARRISRAVWKRSSGRLFIARKQMLSRTGFTARCRDGGCGGSDTCWMAMPKGVSPMKGGRPESR